MKLCIAVVSLCERRGTGTERAKMYVSRAVSGSRKNESDRAEREAGGRGAVSEDHRNGL